jgi:hypothetical protein
MRKDVMKHLGRCFCGAVEIEVTGAPEAIDFSAELGGSGEIIAE